MQSILFVCLGNICRSPLAEGAFRARAEAAGIADRVTVESAGIGAWHAGRPPDRRAIHVAATSGFDISGQRARQIRHADFHTFDLVLAMDRDNLADLRGLAAVSATAEMDLFLRYALDRDAEVPDPYYGGDEGFESVLEMLDEAAEALVARLAN